MHLRCLFYAGARAFLRVSGVCVCGVRKHNVPTVSLLWRVRGACAWRVCVACCVLAWLIDACGRRERARRGGISFFQTTRRTEETKTTTTTTRRTRLLRPLALHAEVFAQLGGVGGALARALHAQLLLARVVLGRPRVLLELLPK